MGLEASQADSQEAVSPLAGDHAVLWGRGSGGAEAIRSVHLVGRELTEAGPVSRCSHPTPCYGTGGIPFSRLSEARTPAFARRRRSRVPLMTLFGRSVGPLGINPSLSR